MHDQGHFIKDHLLKHLQRRDNVKSKECLECTLRLPPCINTKVTEVEARAETSVLRPSRRICRASDSNASNHFMALEKAGHKIQVNAHRLAQTVDAS